MRGKVLAALAALFVVDLLVVVLGYRAHTGVLPPLQRSAPGFEVDPTSSGVPTGGPTAADEVVGPVLLGVNAAGEVLRATRGACEERFDNPARIWAGNVDDGAGLAPVDPPGIHEVLGLMVYADGALRVSGLDEGCQPVTFDSDDGGASWAASEVSEVWRLSPNVQALTVTGPDGAPVTVPCPASQMVNLRGKKAVASCSSQTFVPLTTAERRPQGLTAGNYQQLSVTAGIDEGSYFVLGASEGCMASLAILVPAEQTLDELECFEEDKAPLAIASAGGLLAIQLGNDLRVSRDEGGSFEPVGEPSPIEGSTAATS